MIKVNDKEIENIYFNGTKLDHVYVNGVMVYESTVYVAKPTISGAYTFDTLEHKAVISNTNEDAYVISGVTNASAAGTYTVKFTLNKGYAWNDESTDPIELKWSIAKRVVSVPKLNVTSFAWVEGAQHGVIVSGIDMTYVSQSGDTDQTDNGNNIGAQHAVTWSLKYPASTTWTDGSNSNKSQTWTVSWQSGTSHYKCDIFNDGWGFENIQFGAYITGGTMKDNCIYINSNRAGYNLFITKIGFARAGSIGHMLVKSQDYGAGANILSIFPCVPGNGSSGSIENVPGYSINTTSLSWTELAFKYTQSSIDKGATGIGLRGSAGPDNPGTSGGWAKRIWIT